MGTNDTTTTCTIDEGEEEARGASVTLQALMDSAVVYARCLAHGCTRGKNCHGYRALRLAAYAHMSEVLDGLANHRTETTREPWQASTHAMEAVADELRIVVSELTWAYRLQADIDAGNVGEC